MLVCPKCQSENPNNSQVCQQCQTSLIYKSCPQCGEKTLFSEANCPACGAFTGELRQIILARPFNKNNSQKQLILDEEYLDLEKRYRIWPSQEKHCLEIMATTSTHTFYKGQVLDSQPLQKSALEVLINQAADFLDDQEQDDPKVLWKQIGIPSVAFPYLALKDLTPILPEVYDGWVDNEKEVIILSDRTNWQTIPDLLINHSLLTLQIIYWLNQTVILWNSLSKVEYSQSLLVEENLRIDEDQTFGLLKLYPDIPDNPPSLEKLGKLWQGWFVKGGYPSSSELATLIQQVADGRLDNLTELRLLLHDLASDQQLNEEEAAIIDNDSLTSTLDPVEEELPELPEFISENLEESPTATDVDNQDATAVLPMELINLTTLGCTDRGRQRHHNEDYFGMNTEIKTQRSNQGTVFKGKGIYIVCDGMGGHAAGEVASKMAVEILQDFFNKYWQEEFPNQETILEGILLANKKLYDVNQTNASSGSGRMGTTLVLILVDQTNVAVAHVGDSRVYAVSRKGGLQQLTIDHEVGQRAIQNGVNPQLAYSRPDAYQLTQALGPHDNNYVQPDIRFLDICEDTLFVLCSDGLCDNDLVEDHWETYLLPLLSSSQSLEKGLNKLMEFGNSYNGHDNITSVLVRLKVRPKVNVEDW